MYAIIRTGGKQAKVEEGDVLDVERLKVADEVTFTPLLLVTDDGTVVSDRKQLGEAKVVAEILGERRGEKLDIFKYKNKTGYRRHQGHRQTYTTIQVIRIEAPGTKKKKSSKKETSKGEDSKKQVAKSAEKNDESRGEPSSKKDDAKQGAKQGGASKGTADETTAEKAADQEA